MATENSESTAVAGSSQSINSIERLVNATPKALDCLAAVLGNGLPWRDQRILTSIILLHGHKPNFEMIIESIGNAIKNCPNGIDDACYIIDKVTSHILKHQSGILVKEWLEELRLHCARRCYEDEFILSIPLCLLELANRSHSHSVSQDFLTGLDNILIGLINHAHAGVPEHLLDSKYCGRLSNAIKAYFRHGDRSRVFASINVDKNLSPGVFKEFKLTPGIDLRLSLVILEQVNYAYIGSLTPQEAAELIRKGLTSTPEPTIES